MYYYEKKIYQANNTKKNTGRHNVTRSSNPINVTEIGNNGTTLSEETKTFLPTII